MKIEEKREIKSVTSVHSNFKKSLVHMYVTGYRIPKSNKNSI